MSIVNSPSNALAADARSLNALKLGAGQDSPAAIKETAKQLESLFMRELIKSMRQANNSMKSGMMDSAGGDLGADLLDQQFSVSMSGMPGGLAQMIERQLTRQTTPAAMPAKDSTLQLPSFEPTVKNLPAKGSNQANFVQKHNEAAKAVEKATGLPAGYMIGQAGHETGWGRSEIKNADGSQSFNLFGIKAGAGWTGKTANVTTTEYINGEPRKVVAKFRAYGSYEESFKDYAKLINDSPRYAKAKTQTGSAYAYASGLQKAGYATDPQYAAKLSRAINTTLHLQRAQA